MAVLRGPLLRPRSAGRDLHWLRPLTLTSMESVLLRGPSGPSPWKRVDFLFPSRWVWLEDLEGLWQCQVEVYEENEFES